MSIEKDTNQIILSEKELELRELIRRKEALLRDFSTEEKRNSSYQGLFAKQQSVDHLTFLDQQIDQIDKNVTHTVNTDSHLKKKLSILLSIPTIQRKDAYTLVAQNPELGSVSPKAIASLLGVAPLQKGSTRPHSRVLSRNALHTLATSAITSITSFREFHLKLITSEKPPNVAIVAVMRKLIVVMNTMIEKDTFWKNQ